MAAKAELGWDVHAHLVPGVDDGVRTIAEAIEAIRALKELGYCGCIVTPHVYRSVHDNDIESIGTAFRELSAEVRAYGIDFGLTLAAEYFADAQLIELAESQSLLSFGPSNARFVLVEFPYIGVPLDWADALSAVTRAGYSPVIAHPERYRYFGADCDEWLDRFGAYPVRYQCEIGSLAGQYGPGPRKIATRLLKRGIPTFWGSDLHRPGHVDRFIRPGLIELRRRGAINPALGSDLATRDDG